MKKFLFIALFGWLWFIALLLSGLICLVVGVIASPIILLESLATHIEKKYYANFE